MSEEHDGLDAPMEQAFQHGMTLAGQLGTELSQTWQKLRERQAKADGAQAALLQQQFNAERTTAVQALTATSDPKWWDAASREEVAKAFEISTAWKDHAPEAAAADQHIRQEVSARYKIAPETLPVFDVPGARKEFGVNSERAKAAQAEALVEKVEASTAQREESQERAAARTTAPETDGPSAEDEAWFAAQLAGSLEPAQMPESNIHEQLAESQSHEQVAATAGNTAGVKWDSAERREALATELRTKAVPDEAITARIHAERQHARPISASVSAKAQAAKKTKAGTGQNQAHTLRKHL